MGGALVDLRARPLAGVAEDASNDAAIAIDAGGAGRNVAENLQRLGATTTLLTGIAADPLGQFLRKHTSDLGIELQTWPCRATGVYLALLHADGGLERGFCQSELDGVSVEQVLTAAGDLRQFAGVAIDANLSAACIEGVAAACRAAGVPYALETTSYQRCTRLLGALAGCQLIKPDRREAEALTGRPCRTIAQGLDCARDLHQRGAAVAVVSLGPDGLCVASRDGVAHLAALPTTVVDVTGAGDALFAAAWLGLLRGSPVDRALEVARLAAALACASARSVSPAIGPHLFAAP